MHKHMGKVVIFGGGVGTSTFIKAANKFNIQVNAVVSSFDDGGSTGIIRRNYGGIALGDFRQSLSASLNLPKTLHGFINYRFASGYLSGTNAGNVLLRAFLNQFKTERSGVRAINALVGSKTTVMPISYDYAILQARLKNGEVLPNQDAIAKYVKTTDNGIADIFFDSPVKINPDVRMAVKAADCLIFAPGHFFTSVLPHIAMPGFAKLWRESHAKKVWFVNLLAHNGQDLNYSLFDYLNWFTQKLGTKPFDIIVINRVIPKDVLQKVSDRYSQINVTSEEVLKINRLGIKVLVADICNRQVRKLVAGDTVARAPLRHHEGKVAKVLQGILTTR
jgi:uncharacterized cofD-like protein